VLVSEGKKNESTHNSVVIHNSHFNLMFFIEFYEYTKYLKIGHSKNLFITITPIHVL
jgi:hypothetical protein